MATPSTKLPYPRQLTKTETLDSLSHWVSCVRNYFRRSPQFQIFFKRTTAWDCSKQNYGFSTPNAEDEADNLEALLDTISSFLPGPYITNQITKNTVNIQSVWDIIWDHYGVKPSQSSFFDYVKISRSSDERYIDLYDKMIYHTQNHLCKEGTNGGVHAGGTLKKDDELTLSHRNSIALDWLKKIDTRLVSIVKTEYSKDLKSGTPLAALVRDIAENVDSLLQRYANQPSSVNSVSGDYADTQDSQVYRVFNRPNQQQFRPRNTNFRGRGQFSAQPSTPRFSSRFPMPSSSNNFRCESCFNLGRRLSIKVDSSHLPQQCPQHNSVRSVQLPEETQDQEDHTVYATESGISSQNIIPWTIDTVNKIMLIEKRMASGSLLKSKSPSITAKLGNIETSCLIDEGSEICCIDHDFAKQNNIFFSRTDESAVGAGSNRMKLMGETDHDIIVEVLPAKHQIHWSLGKCVVVLNLGCSILIGEPGKCINNILTDPVSKKITTVNIHGTSISLPYNKPNISNRSFICRVQETTVLYPNNDLTVPVPSYYKEAQHLFFSPRREALDASPPPQQCQVNNGNVTLVNNTDSPLLLKKNLHYGDITSVSHVSSIPDPSPSPPLPSSNIKSPKPSYLDLTKVDPDNIMPAHWKSHFKTILSQFDDIITPDPGVYNGFYGNTDCSLNFIKDPPASNKARLPSYSHDKLSKMADLMDDMERMGVLCKPEVLGITPKNVHTSYLIPKSDNSYRFVTDFTSLLPFIGKLEVCSPTISQAKRILSSFRYHIELDLSHCYWQGSISPSDSQYLATPHPFGGLRVYCREPQGIRNASEHNSERLARIFGDLEQQKKMCRLADGLYIGGNTFDELSTNFTTVMNRAKLCNLTFKPTKIVVCPESTVLFGWKKSGKNWSPTNHVISPLAQAPVPKTVKQLRGFIGAYRQLSSTIPNYSIHLQGLEKYAGGKNSRDYVKWTEDLTKEFETAKDSLKNIQSITMPLPTDILHIYTDFSETANAVGAHLLIQRDKDDKNFLNGGYYSTRLEDCQTRWTPCEKECLGIKLSIEHFKPFMLESQNRTMIHTDNLICVQAWNRLKLGLISTSSKVAAFLSCLCENNVEIVHFPGRLTKVADFASRNPVPCEEKNCQTCSYAFDQVELGDLTQLRTITIADLESGLYKLPLSEKPTWLRIQKEDDTHRRLYNLITSGGLQPEPKLRGHSDLKLMYNMYKKGTLSVDSSGLIIIKHIENNTGLEYNAISVPKPFYASLLQSLHIKLNHPSRAQLLKFTNRHFFCIGSTTSIESVHKSCEICSRVAILPKHNEEFSTKPNPVFGQNFSADVLVSDNQKIFICRENLSQFTFTKLIPDETTETLMNAIIESVIELMPITGCTVRVDPCPAFQSLAHSLSDNLLSRYNIKLDIGRVHNKNKNPIAENCIKEFRKEKIRLKQSGGPISDLERILITRNINLRIRNRGLSAKEMCLKRDISSNKHIDVSDSTLCENQYKKKQKSNAPKKNLNEDSLNHQFKKGDRVIIKNDLNKYRGREEYIISNFKTIDQVTWAVLRKSEKSFRDKTYDLKLSEILPLHSGFKEKSSPFYGFEKEEIHTNGDQLKKVIKKLSEKKTDPNSFEYQDDEHFHGFDVSDIPSANKKLDQTIHELSSSNFEEKNNFTMHVFDINSKNSKKHVPPLYGWIEDQWYEMLDDDEEFYPQNHAFFYEDDYYEDLNSINPNISGSHIDIDDKSVIESISSNNLSLVIPEWDFSEKNNAAKTIQKFWREYKEKKNISLRQTTRKRSSTNPYFLVKIPIVSDSSSELSSEDNDDDIFLSPCPSSTPLQLCPSDEIEPGRVYDVSHALSQLGIPSDLSQVQDVSQALDLLSPTPRRSRRNAVRHDYNSVHHTGFNQ